MLVIESMDADSETRRLSPLALDGGGAMEYGPYTDLLNGPMDHGKRLIEHSGQNTTYFVCGAWSIP